MEKNILQVIKNLQGLMKCSSCGAEVENGICSFCGSKREYDKTQKLVQELESLLLKNGISFKIFIELLNIKDLNIPFINRVINENKAYYRRYLKEKYEGKEYNEVIDLLTKKNADYIADIDTLFSDLALRFYTEGTNSLSDESYIKFIEFYISRVLEFSNFRDLNNRVPKIEFVTNKEITKASRTKDKTKITHGLCSRCNDSYYIRINKEWILANKSKPLHNSIVAIYHELQHVVQENYYRNPGRYCLTGYLIAMDAIIDDKIKGYYNENYDKLPMEANAEYWACYILKNDLLTLGIYKGELEKSLQNLFLLSVNTHRTIEGKQVEIDDIFDGMSIPNSALSEYPILSLGYNIDGKNLVKKSAKELESIRAKTKDERIVHILDYALSTAKKRDYK